MNDANDFSNELTELLKRTYKHYSRDVSFDDISVLSTDDNRKYAVGIMRERNEEYTNGGDYKPHMHSSSTVFAAELDDNRKLTGNSICINGEAFETRHHSDSYISKMIHLSNEDLLKPEDAYTRISIDINKSDALQKSSPDGSSFGDYATYVEGYFDMTDRADLLNAARSKKHWKNFRNNGENEKIAKICSQFLIPNASDEKYREEENTRRDKNAKLQKLKQRIEKRQALRKFAEEEHKELKVFGTGEVQKSVRKILAKIKTPKMVQSGRKEKEEKANDELNTRRKWRNFHNFVQTIRDS